MSKILVAYFSASGTTARVAKNLAEATGADLYEIAPKVPYTSADLNWNDRNSRSSKEMNDRANRPELSDRNAKIDEHDTIFIGFPIWWYQAPRIIETFLESYDFAGKTLIVFATSGGSGLGRTEELLRPCASSDARWLPGKLVNGLGADALRQWVEGLGIAL